MTATITAHNLDAERALLGALLDAPQLAEHCGVTPGDLAPAPGHPEIMSAILSVYETKGAAHPALVLDELRRRDQLTRIGEGDSRAGVYLADLYAAGRGAGSLGHHALLIREATARRRIVEVGTGLVQAGTTQADLDVVLDRASELSLVLSTVVDEPVDGDAPIAGLGTVTDFVDEPSPPHSWVIPGVVERADRVLIVAGEGIGKSFLARQVTTLLAAGRHPFSPKNAIRPRRTLLVDLENPTDLVRRHLRALVTNVHAEGLDLGDRAWRWNRPGGIDLRSSADRALLARVIEQTRPELVALGPLYKAWHAKVGDTYEIAAAETAAAIDHLRERYGCAFWLEHHAPKGDLAGHRGGPIGSSLWMRWPEFGLVLKPQPNSEKNVYMFDRFRGDRDVRCWPDQLIKHVSRWPWHAYYDPDNQADLLASIDEDGREPSP